MSNKVVCVVGLGYVGLPLALLFDKARLSVIGFDSDQKKLLELKSGIDRTKEVDEEELKNCSIEFTSDETKIKESDFVIVAVPTPIDDKTKNPDLSYVESATKTIGKNLKKGAIVIYESTVYPGATEEVCIPILKIESNMRYKEDFKVGYSPERINPGDKEHTPDKIIKIVSGCDKDSLNKIAELYEKIIKAGVYKAKNIKTAEAAKVIENTQRDLNIALVNELSLIFKRMSLRTRDVIEAAGTKWNYQKYYPGLVGGHCISVDPHYLLYKARTLGYEPKVILAGREVNEYMPIHIANLVMNGFESLGKDPKSARILVMGLSFKENINDVRNSKISRTITELKNAGCVVEGYDPLLTDHLIKSEFGITSSNLKSIESKYDAIILSVVHDDFKKITLQELREIANNHCVFIDIKSFFEKSLLEELGFVYYSL